MHSVKDSSIEVELALSGINQIERAEDQGLER